MRYLALLGVLITGCSGGDLTRREAARQLRSNLVEGYCSLNTVLSRKPEFAALRNQSLCTLDVEVTGIQLGVLGETVSLVHWNLETEYNAPTIQAWLSAMDSLQSRLLALPAEIAWVQWGICPGQKSGTIRWVDSTDGQTFGPLEFSCQFTVKLTIADTGPWSELQQLRRQVESWRDKPQATVSNTSAFQRYDDGWRLAN